jgi:putative CocE/NonD family hydrolase
MSASPVAASRMGSFALALALLSCIGAWAQEKTEADPGRVDTEVSLQWAVKIPVADGTVLNGTLYRPASSDGRRLPTIVTITPYISDRYHPDALYFARNDFAFLIVDTRGRGNSGGVFKPLGVEDGSDGHDVVEWIAEQPWSDGKVMMRGGSYGGYNQWATARYFPEHLVSIAPVASPYLGIDFPMDYNVQYLYPIRWLTLTSGVTPQGRLFGDTRFWNNKYRRYHESGEASENLDRIVGNPSEQFQEWINHPMQDDYWAARVPSAKQYAELELPILTITGYYDGDQPGAMEYYKRHMRFGSDKGQASHYLVLGPWNHGGTRFPVQEFGGIKFGDAMMFDAFRLDRDWYNWTLGKGERPAFLLDRVTYFVAGENVWKGAPSLEEIADSQRVLHLRSDGSADSLFNAGELSLEPLATRDTDNYIYDPLDLSKIESDPSEDYIVDQTDVFATNGDGLIYQTAPFNEPVEISGYPRFEAWLEMNVPDTDVEVTLYEVLADGSSIALSTQTQRARYRESLSSKKFMTPGEIAHFRFENFYFFSRLVAKGSRLRLFIRPANRLEQQRHYNAATPVHRQTAADAQTATVRLHMGPDTPSRLIVPVVDRQGSR